MKGTTTAPRPARQLTWPWFLVVVVVYAAITFRHAGMTEGPEVGR